MKLMVLDASVVAPYLIDDESAQRIPEVMECLIEGWAVVPQHWRLEVANLGRKAVRRKRLLLNEFLELVSLFGAFGVTTDDQTDALAWGRILDLANAHDLTTYDAAYLELALRRGLPLASLDRQLRTAAKRVGIRLLAA